MFVRRRSGGREGLGRAGGSVGERPSLVGRRSYRRHGVVDDFVGCVTVERHRLQVRVEPLNGWRVCRARGKKAMSGGVGVRGHVRSGSAAQPNAHRHPSLTPPLPKPPRPRPRPHRRVRLPGFS